MRSAIDAHPAPDAPGEPTAYDTPAVALHWLLAALIVVAFFMGLVMADMRFSPLRLRLYNWHKWLGVAVLALSVLRLLWRFRRRGPALPARMPAWQAGAYRATHVVFYGLFLLVPVLGWMYTSAVGVPVVWLGVLPLPDLAPVNKPFGEAVLKPLHSAASYLLAGVVVVHVAAALKHQFVDGDHLLARMWPWWPSRRQPS